MQLFLAELTRIWTLYRRYPMNYFSGLLMMLFMFLGLIAGAEYLTATSKMTYNDRLEGVILGYWQWNLSMFAFAYTVSALQSEAARGTLEQIFLSPKGPLRVIMTRTLASLGLTVGTSTALLLILLHLSDQQISYPPLLVWPLLTVLLAAYGIGLALGGLTLVYKEVNRVMVIVKIGLVPMVAVAFEDIGTLSPIIYNSLPIAPSSVALRHLMAREIQPTTLELLVASANGITYMSFGLLLFAWAIRKARREALLGQH